MSRVLVAGGTGFLGGAIVETLLDRGASVAVLSRDPARAERRFEGRVEGRRGDVTDRDSLAGTLDGIETVVHSVQFSGFPVEAPSRGLTFMAVDAAGTANVVDAASRAGVRKFVYLSGVGADPHSDKAWYRAKGIAERVVRESGLAWSILRPSWVYGPDDVSLNRLVTAIRVVPFFYPQLGPGDQPISPVHVEDLAALAAETVLGAAGDGATLEVGGPEVLTLDEIVRTAMRALGREKPILHVPLWLVKLGAFFLERLPGQVLSRDAVDFIAQGGVADLAAVEHRFPDFEPRDLESGVAAYLR